MKKHILVALILMAVAPISFSQSITDRYQTPVDTPSNIERYKIDYELVDESLIAADKSILNLLNLDAIDRVRQESEDVIYFDEVNEIELRVYSIAKTTARKNKTNSPNSLKH